ncbi:MAG: hypothetical protein MUC43_00380 [Pirellula sp.]|nr:hypothetical protein [Pirellula sp.]
MRSNKSCRYSLAGLSQCIQIAKVNNAVDWCGCASESSVAELRVVSVVQA